MLFLHKAKLQYQFVKENLKKSENLKKLENFQNCLKNKSLHYPWKPRVIKKSWCYSSSKRF